MDPHNRHGEGANGQRETNRTSTTQRINEGDARFHALRSPTPNAGADPSVDFDQLRELLEIREVFNYNGYIVLEARIQQSAKQDIELDNVYVQVREPEKRVSRKYSLISSWRGLPKAPNRGPFGVTITDNDVNILRGSAGESSGSFETSTPSIDLASAMAVASENVSRPTTPSALSLRAHFEGHATPELQMEFKQSDDENSAHFRRLGWNYRRSSYGERRDTAYFEALASASSNTTPAQRKSFQRRLSSAQDCSNSVRGEGDSFAYSRRNSSIGGGHGGGGNTPTTNQGLPSADRSRRQALTPLVEPDPQPETDSSPGNWDAFLAREEAYERHQLSPFEVFLDQAGVEEEDSRMSSFPVNSHYSTATTLPAFEDGDAPDRNEPAIAISGGGAAAVAAAVSANNENDAASNLCFYYNDGTAVYILISPIAANKQLEFRLVCQNAQQRHRHRLSTGSSIDETKHQSADTRTPKSTETRNQVCSISRTVTLMAMDHSAHYKRFLVWSMQQVAFTMNVVLPSDMISLICSYLLYDMPKGLHPASRIVALLENVPESKRIALRYVEGSIQAVRRRSPPKPPLPSRNDARREPSAGGRGDSGQQSPPKNRDDRCSDVWASTVAQARSWRRRSGGGESKVDRSDLESKVNRRTTIEHGRRRRHTLPASGQGRRNQSQRPPVPTVVVSYPSRAQAATQMQKTQVATGNAIGTFASTHSCEASVEVYTSPLRVGPESRALSNEARTHHSTKPLLKETPTSSATKLSQCASSSASRQPRRSSLIHKAFKKTEDDIERKRRRSSYEAKAGTESAGSENKHSQSEQARLGSSSVNATASRSRGLHARTSNPANTANIAAGLGTAAGVKVKDRRRTGEGSKRKPKKSSKQKKSTARLFG